MCSGQPCVPSSQVWPVGLVVGDCDGAALVGPSLGEAEGDLVGDLDGARLGAAVGALVVQTQSPSYGRS